MTGRLVVVGTGIGAARLTAEARAAIEAADELLYLIPDPVSVHAVGQLNPRSRSLEHCYVEGEHRRKAYARMVETIWILSAAAGTSALPSTATPASSSCPRTRR